MSFERRNMGAMVRDGMGGVFRKLTNPGVHVATGGSVLKINNDFSAPVLGKTIFRRSAFGGLFVGKLSTAVNLHLSCRGVGVRCGSVDGPLGFSFSLTVKPVGVADGNLRTVDSFVNGRSASCMRLLPGFTLRCR